MTQTATSPRTYVVYVVDTNRQAHTIRVESDDWRGVKATARRIAKSQGVKVAYVESMFIAS